MKCYSDGFRDEDRSIPLSIPLIGERERTCVLECLDSAWISSSGDYSRRFETSVSNYLGVADAVAVVNGTAALHVALLLAGVAGGDEVIVPTLTFIAPVNAVRYAGAEPVFMDCDHFLNMDVRKLRAFCEKECEPQEGRLFNRRSGRCVRAVIPVHVFGAVCDMDEMMAIADEFGLFIIEDATEALGSLVTAGKYAGNHAGTIGHFGCFSFNGNKIITTGGGGMILASCEEHLSRARYLTTQAKDDDIFYIHNETGYNYRLPALLSALGVAQLERLPDVIARKREIYSLYREAFCDVPGIDVVEVPPYCESNCWMPAVLVDEKRFGVSRDGLLHIVRERGIQARPVWELNHRQKPYALCFAYELERAVCLQGKAMNLPCSAAISNEEIAYVVESIISAGRWVKE